MKRLLLVVACVLVLAGPAGANGFSFDGLYLWGQDYNAWDTVGGYYPNWILGVSLQPGGDLVQPPGGRALPGPLGDGVYYLYAANQIQNNLGAQYGFITMRLFQGSEHYSVNFTRSGVPGEFHLWDQNGNPSPTPGFIGTPTLYFGYAQGQRDKVWNLPTNTGAGDGYADWYLVLGVNVKPTIIPLPGAVWLLGSGLVGLVGWRKFRKS